MSDDARSSPASISCLQHKLLDKPPILAVLVRLRNEMAALPEFWKRLEQQTIFHQLEIIFLDSESDDGSVEFLLQRPCSVYQIPAASFNFGRSVNQIVCLATAPLVMMLSAHVLLDSSDTLERVVAFLEEHARAAVYPRQVPNHIFGSSIYDVARLERRFPSGNVPVEFQRPASFSNAASAFYRSDWHQNAFPETNGSEDFLWAEQHLMRGGQIFYLPYLAVLHSHNDSPQALYDRVRINAVARGLNGSPLHWLRLLLGVYIEMRRYGSPHSEALTFARHHARAYLK